MQRSTDTQRERFLVLRPHVASLIRHADARRRLADVMVALNAADEEGANGIALLSPTLRVEQASPAARKNVARWFGRFGTALPEELADWLRSPFPREPHSIERGGLRLVVQTPTRGTLVLREEHLASASLTSREREILSRVADGLSTRESQTRSGSRRQQSASTSSAPTASSASMAAQRHWPHYGEHLRPEAESTISPRVRTPRPVHTPHGRTRSPRRRPTQPAPRPRAPLEV